ncbi:peptidylprolyl isomerase [Geojedonia litorea]|uniref:peptidylprolyl isomerase n=1 Tax=Geojedonia litorea TaxID=1268269 RepID=A0ABV9MY72_9FLAO
MRINAKLIIIFYVLTLLGCDKEIEDGVRQSDLSKDVEMITDYGTIIMRLSDETPLHRNNFIKLVNQKFYDSLSFHRVIEHFIIQTGHHKTKSSYKEIKNDSIQLPDLIKSEINTNLYHKRGALNAARKGGIANPSHASSGSQFTIVQGQIQNDSTLEVSLKRVNDGLARHKVMNKPEFKDDFSQLLKMLKKVDEINARNIELSEEEEHEMHSAFNELREKMQSHNFDSLAKIELKTMKAYDYPEAHRQMYKSIGGAPHLDQNYTVFGEVVKGMTVVDSIAAVKTGDNDKPIHDVRIISVRMIERKSYN